MVRGFLCNFHFKMIKVMTISEYARHKSVSIQTVYQWIKEKKIKTRIVLGKQVIEM